MTTKNEYEKLELPEELIERFCDEYGINTLPVLQAFVYEIVGDWTLKDSPDFDSIMQRFEESYQGCWPSLGQWAEDYCRENGYLDDISPQFLSDNIDWDGVAKDLEWEHCYVRFDGSYRPFGSETDVTYTEYFIFYLGL